MYEITVEDKFPAAHFLKLYDGSWEERHDHVFKVSVVMRSEKLDSIGVVADFEALKPAIKKTLKEFSDICVNDHPEFGQGRVSNSSVENMARVIFQKLSQNFKSANASLVKVTDWETPVASAGYFA